MRSIDLNCDLGEGAGHDAELMPLVSSANIACGLHAGDAGTMAAAVALALQHGVAIGAHPSLNDRAHFGRRELPVTPAEVHQLVLTQTRLLQAIARQAGGQVVHVKPHGALYNLAARNEDLAAAVAAAVVEAEPALMLVGLSGSRLIAAGRRAGLRVVEEVFADRSYQEDGSLTPRGQPGALLENANAAATQVLRLVREGVVRAVTGKPVPLAADTVCVHGDGPLAVSLIRRLRAEFAKADIAIQAPHP